MSRADAIVQLALEQVELEHSERRFRGCFPLTERGLVRLSVHVALGLGNPFERAAQVPA